MRDIIWIIVDSVRNYTCPAERVDDRGRIQLMNDLADRWVDFRTVVTSAPSTVMSISAMLTSCPAYYLGANFLGMRLKDCGQPNIATILAPYGYKTHAIMVGPYERETWEGVLDIIPRRLWPRKAKHRHEWSNDTVNRALVNLVEDGVRSPFFLLLHYDCRGDEHVSGKVESGLRCLSGAGLMDSAVLLLTSDHGYPDPLRKEEVKRRRELAALQRRTIAHDLVLTDDNVLVPLLLKFPGHTPLRVEQQICTLDYLPTSLELAGIAAYPELHGKSVVPLLEGRAMPELEERMVRIDGRFLAQPGRCTAVRSKTRKYIVYPDAPPNEREQFFDLTRDDLEIHNLLETGPDGHEADIARFTKWLHEDNARCQHFQKQFMKETYLRQWNSVFPFRRKGAPRTVLFVRSLRAGFDELFEQVLEDVYGHGVITATDVGNLGTTSSRSYDLAIAAVPQFREGQAVCRALAVVRARRKILVNLNLNVTRFRRLYALAALATDWRIRKKYYLSEPLYWLSSVLSNK